MDPAFEVHMLTEEGKTKALAIAQSFDRLLTEIRTLVPAGRELSLTHGYEARGGCVLRQERNGEKPLNHLGGSAVIEVRVTLGS